MNEVNETKPVRVSSENHARLLRLGAKGETFNHIITRLIAYAQTHDPHTAELLKEEAP